MPQPSPRPNAGATPVRDPFAPPLPDSPGSTVHWGRLYGSAAALALAAAARIHPGMLVVAVADVQAAARLEQELGFFLSGVDIPILSFPDWETLPYDVFSPLAEIVSQRLLTLHRLGQTERGILIAPVGTLLQRLPPRAYLDANTVVLDVGERLRIEDTRRRLEAAGYTCVPQVMEHGEFAVRGSILDLFPMGADAPYRIDLFDDEIDSIRTFEPESQRSLVQVDGIRFLPAREFPLDEDGIARFRQGFRTAFEGDPQRSLIYREVSQSNAPGGVEYYLPLFFEDTATLFDYLPNDALLVQTELDGEAEAFLGQVQHRQEQRAFDVERPPLPPERLYLSPAAFAERGKTYARVMLSRAEIELTRRKRVSNFATKAPPLLVFQAKAQRPAGALLDFLETQHGRSLFMAESAGRREILFKLLRDQGIRPVLIDDWPAFLASDAPLGLSVAPLEHGLWLEQPSIAVITESQLMGERVRQERRRKRPGRDPDQIVRNLTELHLGAPVVHEEQGVGRYIGLRTLTVGGMQTEFVTLEYAKGDKLYVPVSSLHLISRYTGTSPESAPLHRLGGDQWQRIKRKAARQIRDVAAELLDVHARRAAHQGVAFQAPDDDYAAFCAAFPFEETPDQLQSIEEVLADMQASQPMDRVVCGDVGFGKTEVAMRAAFMATQSNRQVAVLVPTTLLAQQHFQNFSDRFADWPVRVESLSRFRSKKQQDVVLKGMADGTVDIVIGTHKLLQPDIRFKNLGLAIIDEEHRFGVRHKERLKALRSEVDLLTLTATPIPRTLNMALSGLRELSIIATPPAHRHPVKTFISEWDDGLIGEACFREIKRGGQVYVLHNEVRSIERKAEDLEKLLPNVRIRIAHGQMSERELEQVMLDFYHQRFHVLVCTTIIESGIDVPSANTIVINRADKLGLAQLHQIRGRVGRSHHRAYAYLIKPPKAALTPDAVKRLEAIESLEDLGAGFTLATHDLEIRGAGELLGEGQSGQIQEVGFSLYTELLERAVEALKSGREPELERPLNHGPEVDLQMPALLPEDYLPDVHSRLVLYKRIANAASDQDLDELQVEMIDRFGLLPEPAKNLFEVTGVKLKAQPLGIHKIEAGAKGGRIVFGPEPDVDPTRIIQLIQSKPSIYRFDGGDKLRFTLEMPAPSQRIERVTELLKGLASS